jgi:hypothetical protein
MNEVDSETIRYIPVVMERREFLHLGLPVKLISPIATNLPQKLEVDPVLPSGALDLVRPASSPQPGSKVVHRGLRERYGKRFNAHQIPIPGEAAA